MTMQLESEDYAWMIAEAKLWAREVCNGRLVVLLEGGYNVVVLAECVALTLQTLQLDFND